ncbi:unnamed protein product [Orchesella dallaii]|uniref:G-protein coupled receptors family 1 profile domain-containing protein n=1 Tax=Orchesella dallaii TaxID=48710 RepID=A0ABP1S4Z5_9HEXA
MGKDSMLMLLTFSGLVGDDDDDHGAKLDGLVIAVNDRKVIIYIPTHYIGQQLERMDMDDLSLEMMYMHSTGLTGNHTSTQDYPNSYGVLASSNRTAIDDDPGGMDADYSGNWSGCVPIDHPFGQPTTALFQFIVNGLGISIVAVLGIFGNILSAVVLSRPQMKSSVTCLLLGLTFCDTLLISVSILVFSMPFLNLYVHSPFLWKYENVYFRLWVPYLYPISITAQTGSVYLTLAVTIERYIAVCHSLKARSICTWRRARICVATVFLFSIVYNLPRWWEVIAIPVCDPVNNMTIYMNEKSAMRDDPTYVTVYITWAYLVVMYLIPFSGLVVFNLAIYRQVRKANRERQQLSKLQRREMGLATMLLCVVVVFLLCNVLPLVNNILESFYDTSVDQLVAMSNFLVVVNSSVNFVIYCTCGERFRRLLIRLCRDFIWCRLGTRSNYRGSLYRKSHHYRGADFEEMSMASVANHTCLTTNGGPNGTVVVDLSGQKPNALRGNFRERNKTIPMLHVHAHHHHHHHHNNSNGNATSNNSNNNASMINNSNGRAHVGRRVSSPVGPT